MDESITERPLKAGLLETVDLFHCFLRSSSTGRLDHTLVAPPPPPSSLNVLKEFALSLYGKMVTEHVTDLKISYLCLQTYYQYHISNLVVFNKTQRTLDTHVFLL